jgi:DNA helicase HerA-like ATPase
MPTPAAAGQADTARSDADRSTADRATADRIAQGYATDKPCLTLGSVVVDGTVDPAALVRIPLAMMNRHGLVAGATGTGKTKTLQGIAEQLSSAGVPVIMPDIKGDLTGLSQPGTPNDLIAQRAHDTGDDWQPAAFPVEFLAIAGQGSGLPIRATVDSFGPILLAKVLDLNTTQESTLGMVVHWCDQQHLPLLDLKDLKSVLAYLTSDEGKADLKGIGGVSAATAGVILRALTNLEAQGGDQFFGEPQFDIADLMRVDGQGRGIISLLEVTGLQTRPALYSTFLMWLLAELFDQLPEVGDMEKPKLVFLFDEAHLLFDGASKAFLDALEQTVKLIRSKGVGVFFSTQLPTDVPGPVLSQLGARIQHALRAFTPADQKALTATVQTYPITKDYDLGEALTSLGIGEAIVTVLSDKGAPTPVAWTRMRAPRSLMEAVSPDTIAAAAAGSALAGKYANSIDRESAYEMLTQRLSAAQQAAATAKLAEQRAAEQATWEAEQQKAAEQEAKQQQKLADQQARQQQKLADQQAKEYARQQAAAEREAARYQARGGAMGEIMDNPAVKSFVRSMASAIGGSLGRSLFGTRRRR